MRVITKGFKAHDRNVELGTLNLVVGPNGSGKSTIADALRFLALGYVPTLGKRPVDTAVLMHNGSLSVEMAIDERRSILRSMHRQPGGFTQHAAASWMRDAKSADTERAIVSLFGAEELDAAECLDIRELLAATPNKRSARLEQLLAAGKRTPEEQLAAVARLAVMRLAKTTEERMPANYLDAMPMIPERQIEVLREVAPMLQAKLTEAQLQGALKWANDDKKRAADGLRQKSAAANELQIRAAEVPEPDADHVAEIESERDELQRKVGGLEEQHRMWTSVSSRRRGLEDSLRDVRSIAQRTADALKDAETVHGKEIERLKANRVATHERLESLQTPAMPDRSRAQEIEDQAAKIEAEVRATKVPEIPSIDAPAEVLASIEREIERLKASPWSEVEDCADDLETAMQTKGQKLAFSKILKRLRDLVRTGLGGADQVQLQKRHREARLKLNDAEEKREAATAAATNAQKDIAAKIEKARLIRQKAVKLEDEITEAYAVGRDKHDQSMKEYSALLGDADSRIRQNQEALDAARSEKAAVDRRLATIEDQLRGIGEPGAAPEDPAPVRTRIQELGAEISRFQQAQATHTEIRRALAAIEAAAARRDVFAEVEWALQRQREAEISDSGGRLIRFMTDFLVGAGRTEKPFIRASAGVCAIGWRTVDNLEIQIQALSGGEWCLFATALTAAVNLARTATLKVLLVEAGEADPLILHQLLAGIQKVTDDGHGVTCAIVMTPHANAAAEVEGWNVIQSREPIQA